MVMKKLFVAFVGLLLLLLVASFLVLGPGKTWTLIRAAAGRGERSVDRNLPDEDLEEVVMMKIRDYDERIRDYDANIGKLEDKQATAQRDVEEIENKLKGEKLLLKKAQTMLSEDQPTYVIASRTVSKQQLVTDTESRLARVDELRQRLDIKKKLADDLQRAIDDGRTSLAQARSLRNKSVAELDALRGRLAAARSREEVAQLAEALRDAPSLGEDSDLARAFDQLRERVRGAERRADRGGADARSGVIDWTEPADLRERIQHALDDKGQAVKGQ
jgi:DNA repair exonuclease SbcCD ATPase subunit